MERAKPLSKQLHGQQSNNSSYLIMSSTNSATVRFPSGL